MITPVQFFTVAAASGVGGATFMFAYAVYLTAASFESRVTWEPTATRFDKWRILVRYTVDNAIWSNAPSVVAYGFAIGFAGGALALSIAAGVVAVFV
jgi:uncharacterized protein (DUF2062 family)